MHGDFDMHKNKVTQPHDTCLLWMTFIKLTRNLIPTLRNMHRYHDPNPDLQ
jgi:hypothetical protein